MKRKLLIISFVMIAIMLALAISVSAKTIYKDENGTELFECEIADSYHIASYKIKNGGFAKVDSNGNALTWYLNSTVTEGENTIKYVKSIKTSDCFANGDYTNGVDRYKVVSANWDEGITAIPAFGNWSGNISKEILFVYVPDSVTTLPQRLFQKTSVLFCEIKPTSSLKEINLYMMYEAMSIREIYFPASLEVIKDGTELAINAKRLEKVTFHPDCKLTEIPSCMFQNCSSLKTITLPNSITTVGSRTFQGCSSLEYINLGANLTYMNKTSNNHSFAFQCPKLQTVVIPKTFKAENIGNDLDHAFQTNWSTSNSVVFYYTGTEAEFKLLQEKFAKAGDNSEICGATIENGRLVLANHCETFYGGNHNYKTNDCVQSCDRCGIVTKLENPSHKLSTSITYENGYLEVGTKHEKCTNKDCGYEATFDAKPLILFAGISTNNDNTGICVKYAVDNAAISEYRQAGNTFKYGVVAAANLENNSEVVNADLTSANGNSVVVAQIDDKYSAFDFVLKGFEEKHYTTNIVMCAYMSNGTDVDYVNVGLVAGEKMTVTQGATATTITLKLVAEYYPPTEE